MSNLLDLPPELALDLARVGPFVVRRVPDSRPHRAWQAVSAQRLVGAPVWCDGLLSPRRRRARTRGADRLLTVVRPLTVASVKCVLVDPTLREIEPMALDFVVNFARDNLLRVTTAQLALSVGAMGRKEEGR